MRAVPGRNNNLPGLLFLNGGNRDLEFNIQSVTNMQLELAGQRISPIFSL
jgi:hypothetical protein